MTKSVRRNQGASDCCPFPPNLHPILTEYIRCSESDKTKALYRDMTRSQIELELTILKDIKRLSKQLSQSNEERESIEQELSRLMCDLPSHKLTLQIEKRKEKESLQESPLFYFEEENYAAELSDWIKDEADK